MKTFLFAAALSISSVALAQTAGQNTTQQDMTQQDTTQPSGETVDDPSQSTDPEGVTQQGTDPNGQAAATAGTNEGVQNTPATGMAQPMPNQNAAFTPRSAAGEYPPCSRMVTDNCVQTYERGVRRGRRGR